MATDRDGHVDGDAHDWTPMLLDGVTRTIFRALSHWRGARAFHPRGAAYEAVWVPSSPVGAGGRAAVGPDEGGDATAAGARFDAVVRVSRGVGLPSWLPDVLGVAVKVLDLHGPDQHQDLLLASVAGGGVRSRVLVPRRRFERTTFSTVLPYQLPTGERTPLLATVEGEPDSAADGGRGAAGVRVHVALRSTGRRVGTATLGAALPRSVADDLRYDPWHTGRSLRPVGLLNRLRRPAYLASQQGRDAPGAAGADLPSAPR